jgi:hypothetical protein
MGKPKVTLEDREQKNIVIRLEKFIVIVTYITLFILQQID